MKYLKMGFAPRIHLSRRQFDNFDPKSYKKMVRNIGGLKDSITAEREATEARIESLKEEKEKIKVEQRTIQVSLPARRTKWPVFSGDFFSKRNHIILAESAKMITDYIFARSCRQCGLSWLVSDHHHQQQQQLHRWDVDVFLPYRERFYYFWTKIGSSVLHFKTNEKRN